MRKKNIFANADNFVNLKICAPFQETGPRFLDIDPERQLPMIFLVNYSGFLGNSFESDRHGLDN